MSNLDKKWRVISVTKTNTNGTNLLSDKLEEELNKKENEGYSPEFIFESKSSDEVLIFYKKSQKPLMAK